MTELIENSNNHHLCIKGKSTAEILECLEVSFVKPIVFDNNFDWDFLFSENAEEKKRFILFEKINNWTYLRWNVWDFEQTKGLVATLAKKLNTDVNYFFIDPWIATLRWIIAQNGELTRIYYESHNEILEQCGELELETEIRNRIKERNRDNEFWEDKYWDLYAAMNPPISTINEKKGIEAFIGEID